MHSSPLLDSIYRPCLRYILGTAVCLPASVIMAQLALQQMQVTRDQAVSAAPSGDSRNAWLSVASAAAILFVGVGYTNTFGVFQDYYQKELFPEEPPDKIILIGSVAASLYFVLGAFTGRVADMVGYRWNLLLGTALMSGAMFAASASVSYWQIFMTQGLMFGLGVAFVYSPATAIAGQYFGNGRHGLANGIVVSGGALGGCVLPFSTKELIKNVGLSQTFRILGYVSLGLLVPSILIMKPKKQARPGGDARRPPLLDLKLMSNGQFLALVTACTIAMTGFLPRYFLIPASAIFKGIDASYASWLLGIMNGLSIFGRVGIGCVADRFGPVKALAASFVLCACGHFAFWLPALVVSNGSTDTARALLTSFVVYVGLFGSGFISLFPVVVAHLFGREALASKTGLLNTFVGLSTLAGPSAVYAIIETDTDKHWAFGILTAGVFMLFGGLVLLMNSVVASSSRRS